VRPPVRRRAGTGRGLRCAQSERAGEGDVTATALCETGCGSVVKDDYPVMPGLRARLCENCSRAPSSWVAERILERRALPAQRAVRADRQRAVLLAELSRPVPKERP
jgi:hypothetical protein